jgi:hypothetical protein
MLRRSALRLLLASVVALIVANPVHAHRLDAQADLLPDHKIRVQSWFSNGDVPHGARVEVYGAAGQLLSEGQLDDKGEFIFSFDRPEEFRIVVSAGEGHRKEITVSPLIPLADRHSGDTFKDVLVGLSFVMALAALVLSVRNARHLRTNHRGTETSTYDEARMTKA